MSKWINFDGPCPFLLCLEKGEHWHPVCEKCDAVNHGNLSCAVCRENRGTYDRQIVKQLTEKGFSNVSRTDTRAARSGDRSQDERRERLQASDDSLDFDD